MKTVEKMIWPNRLIITQLLNLQTAYQRYLPTLKILKQFLLFLNFFVFRKDHSEPHSDGTASSKKNNDDTSRTKQKNLIIPKSADTLAPPSNTTIATKLSHRKIISRKRGDDNSMTVTVEQLPTDMSDSSDSESNNIPFVSTAECTSMHEGRQFVHTILPINVDTLSSLLFSKSKFLVDFHNIRKTTNMIHEDWSINEENQKYRKVTLTVALTQAVGPKCAHVDTTSNTKNFNFCVNCVFLLFFFYR